MDTCTSHNETGGVLVAIESASSVGRNKMAEFVDQSDDEVDGLRPYGDDEMFAAAAPVFHGGGEGREQGYIYLMFEKGRGGRPTNNFKVGRTNNPPRRRFNLQTGNPRKLKGMYKFVTDMDEAERKLINARKTASNICILNWVVEKSGFRPSRRRKA